MKQLHYFQHVPFENLGIIEDWARQNGFSVSTTQFHRGQDISMPEDTDWLVVMGGSMGVDDDEACPWLAAEKEAIAKAIEDGKVVLGICLGAQLIAQVLGGDVRTNAFKEIGWFPVYMNNKALDHPMAQVFPSQWDAFHWHGDTFDLPEGTRLLASSQACRSQCFVFKDRVVGLQFHMEMTRKGAEGLVKNCAADITAGEFVSTPEEILAEDALFEDSNTLMVKLLDYLDAL